MGARGRGGHARFVVHEDMQKRTRFGAGPLLGSLAGQMPNFPGLVHFSALLAGFRDTLPVIDFQESDMPSSTVAVAF